MCAQRAWSDCLKALDDARALRTIWNIAGIAIVLAVVSFGVNVAEGRLMQRLAPRSAAELSLAAGPPAPTDTPCAYIGPTADVCDSAGSVPNPCPPEQVSPEAYDACPVYRQQQLAQAQGVCINLTRDSGSYDACVRVQQQALATQVAQRAQAQAACTNVKRDSFYDACVRTQLQDLATQVAQRARDNAQILIPGTLPCPGYDPSLPAPDSCPPGTPRPH
jgi:hypothetical protein